MSPPVRIVIAEDHPLVAQGIRALLVPAYDVVAMVQDAREVESTLAELKPDLLLLDLSMPHRNGFELLTAVRQRFPGMRVLIVTMHLDRAFADLAFQNGADGFVPKEATSEELHGAIGAVLRGERYLSPRVPRRAYREGESVAEELLDRLTPRQRQILRLMGEGRSALDIASLLGLSPRTVEFHRAGIRRALGIASELALVQFAAVARLGSDPEEDA